MSYPVFVSPPTMAWNSTKTQKWNTKIQKSASKRRKTLSRQSYPEYELDCTYTCLDTAEVDYVAGFFAKMHGQAGTFLWKDDQDYKCDKTWIGTGDGSTTGFQIVRSLEGQFFEPVLNIVPGTLKVFVDNVQVSEILGDDGWDVLAAAPAAGSIITASFEYYWRVAFAKDEMEWENFWDRFYRIKSVKLVTVK
jgi:uncharacterized protein (TIGR02217 family)